MKYTYEHNNYLYQYDDKSARFIIYHCGKREFDTDITAVKMNLYDNRIKNIEHGLTQIATMVGSCHEEPIKKLINMCKEERR